MSEDHQCEAEDVCAGLMVMLHLDLIQPLCPQHTYEVLRQLMQYHAESIAAHMVSAGVQAAVQLFQSERETS